MFVCVLFCGALHDHEVCVCVRGECINGWQHALREKRGVNSDCVCVCVYVHKNVCVGVSTVRACSVNEAACLLVFVCVCLYTCIRVYTHLICMAPCPIASIGVCENKDFPFPALLCLQGKA